jgi:hypothetical protein
LSQSSCRSVSGLAGLDRQEPIVVAGERGELAPAEERDQAADAEREHAARDERDDDRRPRGAALLPAVILLGGEDLIDDAADRIHPRLALRGFDE